MNASQLQERIDFVAEHRPALLSRYQKGAALYRANHIQIDQFGRIIVPATAAGHCYSVTIDAAGLAHCGCKDAGHGAPEVRGERLCKHAIAAHLFAKNGAFEEAEA